MGLLFGIIAVIVVVIGLFLILRYASDDSSE